MSCQREVDVDNYAPRITARTEAQSSTRTSLSVDEDGQGTIYWNPADKISVFFGTTRVLYTSQNKADATSAVFQTSDNVTSTTVSSTNIWGLYPSDNSSTCDGNSVITTLPSQQYGIPETFDDDLFITLAHSNSTTLQFYNVCGGIKFSLSRDDIKFISFRGNNNEDLAGKVKLSFSNDLPNATVINGVKEITLTPKTGQTFSKDVNYYIVTLPTTLSNGFTMIFTTTDGAVGTLNYTDKAITLKRSIFSRQKQIDSFATFEGGSQSNNVIYYTTDNGKTITPYKTDVFGAGIVSNEYINGQGILTFDGTVTSIGDYAFFYCTHLTSIVIPDSVTSLGISAFDSCNQLTAFDIPGSVESIDDYAFYNCVNLTSIEIPSSVTQLGDRVFSCCTALASITVDSGNPVYDSRNGCNAIIETKSKALVSGCMNTVIPSSVTGIGKSAFYHLTSLSSIDIPNSVTTIGDHAFFHCSGLKSLVIPYSVTSIEFDAFTGCSGLTSISVNSSNPNYDSRDNCNALIETKSNTLIVGCKNTVIPNTVTIIKDSAFADCTGLTSIEIPKSVTSIGDIAFDSCTGLTSVTVYATTPPSIGNSVFSNTNDCPIYVPAESLDAYKTAQGWSKYADRIFPIAWDSMVISYDFGSDSFCFTCGDSSIALVTSASEMKTSVYDATGRSVDEFHALYNTFKPNDDYNDINNIGVIEEIISSESGYPHFLKWSITPEEAWEYAGKRIQHVVRYYNADNSNLYVVIILEAEIDNILKVYNVTKASYISQYWVNNLSTMILSVADPSYDGDDNNANCVYCNNLNAPFETWTQGEAGVPGVIKINAAISDVQYFFCPYHRNNVPNINGKTVSFTISDDGFSLFATHSGYTEMVATIDNDGINYLNTIMLNKESEIAKKLLNTGQFYVNIGAKGHYCKDENKEVAITFDGQDHFQAHYLIPIYISNVSTESFIDGSELGESGSYIRIEDLINPYDWYNRFFSDHLNYWGYYGPFEVMVDLDNVTCDLNDQLSILPDSLEISLSWELPTDTMFGCLTYTNRGYLFDNDFNLYINATVRYGWGEIIKEHIRIPVKCSQTTSSVPIPEAVDMGLSVKWASFNLGATKPEEYGDYYAWGETKPKKNYSWDTYKWGNPPTKYNQTDGLKTLEAEDDVVHLELKGKWRMPTLAEEEELYSKCSHKYIQLNGIYGYQFTGPNGNSIFVPGAGLYDGDDQLVFANGKGWYWSSTLSSSYLYARGFQFESTIFSTWITNHDRCDGHVIRPVYAE